MKKLLIGFLAVGLIMGFTMTASAQTSFKASGQYYVYGQYVDNVSNLKKVDGNISPVGSRANIASRLRMQFEFQVQEGLKLTTRFDALEKLWGEQNTAGSSINKPGLSGGTVLFGDLSAERNLSWERAYVTFNALYGVWDVGYQQSRAWGTCAFCDDYDSDPGIHYRYMMGPWTLGLEWEKRADTGWFGEGSMQQQVGTTGVRQLGGTDNDHDVYHIYGIYRWATGQAGLRFELDRNATDGKNLIGRTAPYGYSSNPASNEWTSTFYEIAPYVQWKSGPFDLEGELRYIWGKTDYAGLGGVAAASSVDRAGYSIYLNGKYTMGAWYGGLELAWITGDDPNTPTKNEKGVEGGQAWDPMLIYGNYWYTKYQLASSAASSETNVKMFKPYVGWKVNPQLEIVAQFGYMLADQKPTTAYISDEYGKEFDLYATYKLYNNLSYTVGFGYFWAGDYYKGTVSTTQLENNYVVMNALNFTF